MEPFTLDIARNASKRLKKQFPRLLFEVNKLATSEDASPKRHMVFGVDDAIALGALMIAAAQLGYQIWIEQRKNATAADLDSKTKILLEMKRRLSDKKASAEIDENDANLIMNSVIETIFEEDLD
jgi:hypothetical protein